MEKRIVNTRQLACWFKMCGVDPKMCWDWACYGTQHINGYEKPVYDMLWESYWGWAGSKAVDTE